MNTLLPSGLTVLSEPRPGYHLCECPHCRQKSLKRTAELLNPLCCPCQRDLSSPATPSPHKELRRAEGFLRYKKVPYRINYSLFFDGESQVFDIVVFNDGFPCLAIRYLPSKYTTFNPKIHSSRVSFEQMQREANHAVKFAAKANLPLITLTSKDADKSIPAIINPYLPLKRNEVTPNV